MDSPLEAYERLGSFYLGRLFDYKRGETTNTPLLYDSRDLVTHGVIVGMTGSGKTGLGISILEEAAIDGIPALVVDPKGDLSNLLLTFPELRRRDFEPWVNLEDATRKNLSPSTYAEQQATFWKQGLADWHQDGSRIARLRATADLQIYTPGSDAGTPISILSTFSCPPKAVREDADLLNDRIGTTVTSLLGLLGIDADPIQSREHILLTNILHHVWKENKDIDLGRLIHLVQKPPMQRIGVMDLESFFPAKERFALAMSINNLLASPSFATWIKGAPMDIDRLLYTESGKPRICILSIAHLTDAERMFFVSLLLNQTVGWMRSCSGTSSLRALLYIDEIFGYMPPVGAPPSKKALLTLLKQARAFGLGCILATQNPVDLDYKGLSNTGTWFIGRLQTEQDKQRILDGLKGVANGSGSSFDTSELSRLLSGLGKRVFLLHNVHDDAPLLFQTRWALSYLAGPMTRSQIKQLSVAPEANTRDATEAVPETVPRPSEPTPTRSPIHDEADSAPPLLPPEIPQLYAPVNLPPDTTQVIYTARLVAHAQVHFVDTRRGLAADREFLFWSEFPQASGTVHWQAADPPTLSVDALETSPEDGAGFTGPPASAGTAKNYRQWKKDLESKIYRTERVSVWKSPTYREFSQPGEQERDFRVRLLQQAHERRDEMVDALRDRYTTKFRRLAERIRKAEQVVDREASQANDAQFQNVVTIGSTILAAVLGRKWLGSRSARAARGWSRASKQAQDVARAERNLADLHEDVDGLEAKLAEEIQDIEDRLDPLQETLTEYDLKPRKSDIDIRLVALCWYPST